MPEYQLTELRKFKINLKDKIKCELETANGFLTKMEKYLTVKQMGIFEGKVQFGEDMKQWVEDLERED